LELLVQWRLDAPFEKIGISAIPTLVLFRDSKEVERVSGALPLEELRRFADAATFSVAR